MTVEGDDAAQWKAAYEILSKRIEETLRRVFCVLTGHPPEDGRVVRQEEVVTLASKLRKDVSDMHRRAQRLEGIEAHMATLRETHARELGMIMHRAQYESELWWSRYRSGVEQIKSAGVSDRIDGHDNHRTGSLSELILRLVRERDAAIARAREAEKVANLVMSSGLAAVEEVKESMRWRLASSEAVCHYAQRLVDAAEDMVSDTGAPYRDLKVALIRLRDP